MTGNDSNKKAMQELLLTRFSYVTGWQDKGKPGLYSCSMHQHPTFEIVYHPNGKGLSNTGKGEQLLFSPGSVIIYPPRLEHDQKMETSGIDICVHFDIAGHIPLALENVINIPGMRDRMLETDLARLAAPDPKMSALRKAAFDHRVSAIVLALLEIKSAGQEMEDKHPAARAGLAHTFIMEKYATIACLEDVAKAIGISHDRLRHVFRERYGIGLHRFLQQTRLERAATLLTHSSLPLKIICSMCGFANERYLCSAFKQWSGNTPGDFRAKHGR